MHGKKSKPKIVSFFVFLPFLLKRRKTQHDQNGQACFLAPGPTCFTVSLHFFLPQFIIVFFSYSVSGCAVSLPTVRLPLSALVDDSSP